MGMIEALEKVIAENFKTFGIFIGKRPLQIIAIVLIISIFMSLGLFKLNEISNVRTEYSPTDAPSRTEYAVAMNFLGQNGTLDPVYVFIRARDNGSLLRDEHQKALVQLIERTQFNFTIEYKGQQYGYKELCEPYCELNTAFLAFLKFYDSNNPETYTYPSIDIFGSQFFIGNNVYGVEFENGTDFIKSFTIAHIGLFISSTENEILCKFQSEIERYYNKEESGLLIANLDSDCVVSAEVRRLGLEVSPVVVVSALLIIAFVVISSIRRNPVKSKPWVSLIGSLMPILSIFMSTGTLSLWGLPYQSIVVVTYFLVLAVGVDDVFIILRGWDRTHTAMPIPERLAKTLQYAGPSITVSSLTNALSFGVGIFSKTPAVRTFSIYSCFGIIFCYFLQLILFSAVLALSGKYERNNQRAFCCFKSSSNAENKITEEISHFQTWLIKKWSFLMTSSFVRILLVLVLAMYYCISILGVLKMEAKISVNKVILPDSYLNYFQSAMKNALRNMQPVSVFVLNPGDLRDPNRLNGIRSLVSEYEHSLHSYGNKSTIFWLQQYEKFLSYYGESENFTYIEIPAFLESTMYLFHNSFVEMNETACHENQPQCITSFFFVTNFHEVIQYDELIPVVDDWRNIAAKYSDYKVYPYSDHAPFVDQTMAIKSMIIWSAIAALFCSAAACFIFMPNIISIGCAVFSIFSISIGICGLLSHMRVDLDPITMAALLMAIGFAVDFTAHISYHYYKTTSKDSRDRLEETLNTIGWTVLQVAFSTNIAVLPLFLKQSYLTMVFMKTVTITVVLGIFHSFIILPVLLAITNTIMQGSWKEKKNHQKSQKMINKIQNEVKRIQHTNKITQIGHDKMQKNGQILDTINIT